MKQVLLVLLCCIAPLAITKVYVWEDAKGNPVFSNLPPKEGEAVEYKLGDELEEINLPLTVNNITGMWTQYGEDGDYSTLELNDKNEFVILKYTNFSAYYRSQGVWNIEGDKIKVTVNTVINQQSNYKSDAKTRETWYVDTLYENELSLIIEAELIKYNR